MYTNTHPHQTSQPNILLHIQGVPFACGVGLVDMNFSTVGPILLGLMGIGQKWTGN